MMSKLLSRNSYAGLSLAVWVATALAVAAPSTVHAQRGGTRRVSVNRGGYQQYFSLSVGTGTSFYYGDLAETGNSLTNPRQQLNFGFKARFNQRFSVRAEGQYYSIAGSDAVQGDASRAKRNLSFRANNFEVSAIGQFDFVRPVPYADRYSRRSPLNAYVFAGLGFTTNNPQAQYKGQWVALRGLQTEGVAYSGIQPVVPIGIGARLSIGPTSDLLIEYGYRITFTDYLDDVSGTYLTPGNYISPTAAALGDRRGELNPAFNDPAYAAKQYKYRGNPGRNDAYAIFSIKYQHTFTPTSFERWKRGLTNRRYRSRFNRYK